MTNSSKTFSRREFLRQAACAGVGLGLTTMVNQLAPLRLASAALAQQDLNDYKALICIFLSGGNDSNNLLVPMGSSASSDLRADYEAGRGQLALSEGMHSLNLANSGTAFNKFHGGSVHSMGLHPSAPELATMFNSGDLALVCNVGSLAFPIESRQDLVDGRVVLPPSLYSHSDQVMQWQTSIPDQPFETGWGGRIADLLHGAYNSDASRVSMSMSMNGINAFQRGISNETSAFSVGTSGVTPIKGFGTSYSAAYSGDSTFHDPVYKTNEQGHRLKAMESLVKLTHANLMEDAYANKIVSARNVEDAIGDALIQADNSGVDFDSHFAAIDTNLARQMKMVARLIAGRSFLGNRRQVFFVSVGGYDIHKNHLAAHADLMDELSKSLAAFRSAMIDVGDWDKTVAFTASDFSRTFTANGPNAEDGTDHAWGSHMVVAGGPVIGGQLYGYYPSLKVGDQEGSIDAHTTRGRWIPSTAVDQYSAVLARWFGVESNAMEEIFPNLGRFNNPFTSTEPNLAFLPMF